MRILVVTLLTFKKVKLIFGHPVYINSTMKGIIRDMKLKLMTIETQWLKKPRKILHK